MTFGNDAGETNHCAPVGPGTFVHFDAGREWSAEGEHGLSLRQAALHEIGHALGMGHGTTQNEVMYFQINNFNQDGILDPQDVAGIRALYGSVGGGGGDAGNTFATAANPVTGSNGSCSNTAGAVTNDASEK